MNPERAAEIEAEVATKAAAKEFAESELSQGRPNRVVEDALVDRGIEREEAVALVFGIQAQLDQESAEENSAEEKSEWLGEGLELVLFAAWAIYVAFDTSGEFLGPDTGDHLTSLVIGLGFLLAAWAGYRRRPWRRIGRGYGSSDSPTAS